MIRALSGPFRPFAWVDYVPARFRELSLIRQFALAGGLVMSIGMLCLGQFLSAVLAREAVHDTASVTALLLDSVVSPLAQGLVASDTLGSASSNRLDEILRDPEFRDRFPYLEIWKPDGAIAYSNTRQLIGHVFDRPAAMKVALSGDIASQYTDLTAQEHVTRGFEVSYLEIYTPIREDISGKIIAVAEIHEVTEPLYDRVRQAQLQGWTIVAAISLVMMGSLFGIVYRGSRTISMQKKDLQTRMSEVEKASLRNQALRRRVQRASGQAAELNENYLKRIGADLHDGPSQLIAGATLKLEAVRHAADIATRETALHGVARVLSDALQEIREISRGLMLPEIERLSLCAVVGRAVLAHQNRTDTYVETFCDDADEQISHPVKICVYRFVQEGLTNAFRHGSGVGQQVSCKIDGTILRITVCDRGASPIAIDTAQNGMGLAGLRHRVESLGGRFRFEKNASGGSCLEMLLHLRGDPIDE
ncbi:histidine kinase [Mesorhizobium sp. SB112]|uniref:sensor histidine kinase n=1 Tax=Mesorhizobium sp. SB112 TaxID=3151853 RepID=UPI003266FAC8